MTDQDGAARSLATLEASVTHCQACPRLVEWRTQVAVERRAAFRNEEYWGRPVPGFGDPAARIVVLGLAPAAHGGNRTGRVFTGDRSGDWLFAAMHRAGLANQPESVNREDGLRLHGAWVTAAVKCAPPANKPTVGERDECVSRWLRHEFDFLGDLRVIVCLGRFAYDVAAAFLNLRPRPPFGHGVEVPLGEGRTIVCSFHPSQQNTFTGKLTEPMIDAVFDRAVALAGPSSPLT